MAKKPKPLDVGALTAGQQNANRQAALDTLNFNALDVTTPFGTSTFQRDASGRPIGVTSTLSPQEQLILNFQQQARRLAGQEASGIVSQGGFVGDPFSASDFADERNRIERSQFARAQALLDPVFEERGRALNQSIADRGIPLGGEDAQRQLGFFEDSRNRALQDAAFDAIQAGGAEQDRLFNLGLTSRNERANRFAQLLGATGNPQAPQAAIPQAAIGAVDTQSPAIANFQAANQRRNALTSGLFQLGGSIIGGLRSPGGLFGGRTPSAGGGAGFF